VLQKDAACFLTRDRFRNANVVKAVIICSSCRADAFCVRLGFAPSRDRGGLPDPASQLRFVQVVFADVDPCALPSPCRPGTGSSDVPRKNVTFT
jgi:hypothetical protein